MKGLDSKKNIKSTLIHFFRSNYILLREIVQLIGVIIDKSINLKKKHCKERRVFNSYSLNCYIILHEEPKLL